MYAFTFAKALSNSSCFDVSVIDVTTDSTSGFTEIDAISTFSSHALTV
jgi:hypothetical protein